MGNLLTHFWDWVTPEELKRTQGMSGLPKSLQSKDTEVSEKVTQNVAAALGSTSTAFAKHDTTEAITEILASKAQGGNQFAIFMGANPGMSEILKGLAESSDSIANLNISEKFKVMDPPKKAMMMIGVFVIVAAIAIGIHAKVKHGSIKEYWKSLETFAGKMEKIGKHTQMLKNIGNNPVCKNFGTQLAKSLDIKTDDAVKFLNTTDTCVQDLMKSLLEYAKEMKAQKEIKEQKAVTQA